MNRMEEIELYLPGGVGAPGFVSIPSAEGAVTIRLSARQSHLLVQLAMTRQRQSRWPRDSCGWMTAQRLGEALGHGPREYIVSPESVRKYIGRIRTKLRQHLGPAHASFELFERVPMLGYRLAIEMKLFIEEPLLPAA
jgi:hypothetical protein